MATTTWLVTGGAGYVGAHVVRALVGSGRSVVVVDDLTNGLATRLPPDVELVESTVLDTAVLADLLDRLRPSGVLHLAAKKSPTESVGDPLGYAQENVGGLVSLLRAVRAAGVTRVVFSSSCSVYGTPSSPDGVVDEDAAKDPESPYGESKLYGEKVLAAAAAAHGWGALSLRYFNVIGAAAPALRDTGVHNLVPQAFRALRDDVPIYVFGDDYATGDGTCVRDYVDVRDVADAHVRAAEVLESAPRVAAYNVGRGEGSSVLEVLQTVRAVTGLPLRHEVRDRRPGDPARIVGRVDRIAHELGWTARHDLGAMVRSAWAAESGRATREPAELAQERA